MVQPRLANPSLGCRFAARKQPARLTFNVKPDLRRSIHPSPRHQSRHAKPPAHEPSEGISMARSKLNALVRSLTLAASVGAPCLAAAA
ncbi:hypothetical protein FV228_15495, partial [Methylobacterium sp. WL18]